ncbi:MAG TPA: cytochrome c3 family protein [Syntrophales bacterium]|nr:cytochrome c3 family protein [Syntrophales bacterium]
MNRLLLYFACVIVLLVVPAAVFAAGAHDGLSCTGCHALHTAKESMFIFAVEPNKKEINPRTKQAYSGISALCLGCHQTPEKGGQGMTPISSHMSHPFGLSSINPKIARVAPDLLRDGKFECVSCHDPHPSNTNYKYLRIDTANGSKMENFCATCHPMKADPKTAAAKVSSFSSMDERSYAKSAPVNAPHDVTVSPNTNKP